MKNTLSGKQFNLLPTNDWKNEATEYCGSLWPICTKTSAIAYAKSVKKKFPHIEFELTTGKTFAELELVAVF